MFKESKNKTLERGQITVFFSLIFILTISFICSLVESARLQGARMQLELAADAACESIFAAFDRELFQQFQVFFFDASFGNGKISEANALCEIERYLNDNLHPENGLIYQNTDFYQLQYTGGKLERIALASDDKGMVFREEAIHCMKGKFGIAFAEELLKQCNIMKNNLKQAKDYETAASDNETTLQTLAEEKQTVDQQNPEGKAQAEQVENPSVIIQEKKAAGVLTLVMPTDKTISSIGMDQSRLPCGRDLNRGAGCRPYSQDLLSNVLFNEYLMRQFSCASDDGNKTNQLCYQLEYLLQGKMHDTDNLKSIVGKLLLVREGANFVYLLTDSAKVMEAELLATALVGYTGLLPLIEATKYALLLAWAYAESVHDVKRLLAGKKVALIKDASNWQLGLSNITQTSSGQLKDDEQGITYRQYLRILLLLEKPDVLAQRAIDLTEMKMRSLEGQENFQIDHMASQMSVSIDVKSLSVFYCLPFMRKGNWNGKANYHLRRAFSYSMWR